MFPSGSRFKSHSPHHEQTYPKIVDFALWLKKTHRLMDATIESKVRRIKRLAKKVNIWNIEEVKDTITLASWSNIYKELMEYAYCDWCEFQGFKYKPRSYYREETLPYIPTGKDIDHLIAGINKKYAPLLQLLKESGWRSRSFNSRNSVFNNL